MILVAARPINKLGVSGVRRSRARLGSSNPSSELATGHSPRRPSQVVRRGGIVSARARMEAPRSADGADRVASRAALRDAARPPPGSSARGTSSGTTNDACARVVSGKENASSSHSALQARNEALASSLREAVLHNARLVAERETLREALEAAEEERSAIRERVLELEVSRAERVGVERALAVAADEAAVSAQQATEMAEQIRAALALVDEANARADAATAERDALRDAETAREGRADENAQDENASALLGRVEGMREAAHEAVRRVRLEQIKEQHIAAMRVGEHARAAEEARRARERAEEAAAAARKDARELRDALLRERAARRAASAASPYRDVARRLARGVAEAVEFGLGAAAVDLPTAPPSAGSPEADANAAFWYDAERDEIFLAEISLEANERERRREGPGGTAEGRREG